MVRQARAAALGALALVGGFALYVAMGGPNPATRETGGETKPESVAANRIENLPIVDFHGDYVHSAESLKELAAKSSALVHARAKGATFQWSPAAELTYTHQDFSTVSVVWGKVDDSFSVYIPGGPTETPEGTVLVQDPENPQFKEGQEYLLALVPRETAPGEYFTIGASQGRYEIKDGSLLAVSESKDFRIEALLGGETLASAERMLKEARSSR